MTLEEKVGQMFIVGFQNGDRPAREMNRQANILIRKDHVGGIILFDRNIGTPRQVGHLTNQLQDTALAVSPQIPLFVSVDQEGGKVARIREGVTNFPGNMALGAARDEELAYQAGRVIGEELRAMGINMNLAPSLDVNNNPANPIIGVRSFSGDPSLTSVMAKANLRGYREGNVLSVIKHFPGHGDTSMDSHVDMPTVDHPFSRLNRVELVPFKSAIREGVDAVMSAHITFPSIDDTPGLPGTLSKKVLTGLLREKLGYDGVIMTDDMEMGAIVENFGSAEAAVRAVKAGADIVLVCHDLTRQQQSIHAVIDAVKKGEISEKRIDHSLQRILRLKAKKLGEHAILHQPKSRTDQMAGKVNTPENRKWAAQAAQMAITPVRNERGVLPLDPRLSGEILAVSPTGAEELGKALKGEGFQTGVRSISMQPKPEEVQQLVHDAASADVVILGAFQWRVNDAQAKLAAELKKTGKPLIVLGLDTPYDLMAASGVKTYLALYSSQPVSMRAAARVIAGRARAEGKLPVRVPGMYPLGYADER
ncbi:beta-N-acetylhexosaminidase [Salinithrix halophila]|uniref:beta-N-acetylhexosaminidase n=2 Tax=Salinithrix halophila TaxID=1485204 RepID=A0ABV8JF19_9BACL